jgi:glycosyltransferase involved in cell wall biosynthesis
VPAADATRRAAPGVPLIVSVHGGDVYGRHADCAAVSRSLSHARLVLANSAGTARRCRDRGASQTRIVHLGADVPAVSERQPTGGPPTLVTVAHLIARKRHADVIRAVALVREHHPELRYVIVGEGPERERLAELAASLGVERQLEFRGQLPNRIATALARRASIFVLPSVDEAFGVAYIEAMAGGAPAIGCLGEDGPQEIADAGGGIALVPPRDPQALADRIRSLLDAPWELEAMGEAARATVQRSFTWERCGEATVAAYRDVLEAHA